MAISPHASSPDPDAIAVPVIPPHHAETRRQNHDQLRLQRQLDAILKRIKSPVMEGAFQRVFNDLSHLHDALRLVELNVSEGGPLSVTLAIFSLIDNESKALVRFIERSTSKMKSIKPPFRQTLDGTSFALRHELKRVFSHDFASLGDATRPDQVRMNVMRVHGLLSNCFQQSILTLARAFDPSVNAALLFDEYKDRLEQSVLLLKDLSALMELARQAGEQQSAEASNRLIQKLQAFSQDTMQWLMYRDWAEFEDISKEVTASFGSARHSFLLHCFVMYLEALINQVQMRAVFSSQAPDSRHLKQVRKSREKPA